MLCSKRLLTLIRHTIRGSSFKFFSVSNYWRETRFYSKDVAVMPFKQRGDKAADYAAGLLQSEMLTFLSQPSQLKIIFERVLAFLSVNSSFGEIRE